MLFRQSSRVTPLSPWDMLLRFWEFFLEGEKRRPCSLSPLPGDCQQERGALRTRSSPLSPWKLAHWVLWGLRLRRGKAPSWSSPVPLCEQSNKQEYGLPGAKMKACVLVGKVETQVPGSGSWD